jgi:hypothetical protein
VYDFLSIHVSVCKSWPDISRSVSVIVTDLLRDCAEGDIHVNLYL